MTVYCRYTDTCAGTRIPQSRGGSSGSSSSFPSTGYTPGSVCCSSPVKVTTCTSLLFATAMRVSLIFYWFFHFQFTKDLALKLSTCNWWNYTLSLHIIFIWTHYKCSSLHMQKLSASYTKGSRTVFWLWLIIIQSLLKLKKFCWQ